MTTGKGRGFANYFSKKMESLRALPKVESGNLLRTEKKERNTALRLKNEIICDPISSDFKNMEVRFVSVAPLAA